MERIWASNLSDDIELGVTIFGKESGTFDHEAVCLSILDTVDLHHGEDSHDPPYSVLEVIGVRLSPELREALGEFSFREFAETAEGFRASK